MESAGMLTRFVLGVAGVLELGAGGCCLVYQTAPLRAAKMTAAMRSFRNSMGLSPLQEDSDAAHNDHQGNSQQNGISEYVHLALVGLQLAVFSFLRANRN